MEKLKEHIKKSIKNNLKESFEKDYPKDWEEKVDCYFNYSKHRIDREIRMLKKIREEKYDRKRIRLLGNKTKAMPHSMFEKLADYYALDDRLHMAIEFQGYEGQRVNDLLHTKINQIDFDTNMCKFYNHKEERWYEVPIHAKIIDELKEYVNKYSEEIKKHDGYLFFTNAVVSKKNHWSMQYFNRKIVAALKDLGLEKVYAISKDGRKLHLYTSHSDRGHASTQVWEKTHSLRAMQKILDHMPKSVGTTLLYKEDTQDELRDAMS